MEKVEKILRIARMGEPILQKPSLPVEDPLRPEIQTLIQDMEATAKYLDCSGLAAPQVFFPFRIVIFRILKTTSNSFYKTSEYDSEDLPWTIMINPAISPLSDSMDMGWEACLSLPGLMGKVPRYHSIEYSYLNRAGKEEKRVAHGFHARVVQHECDHLNGILYPQRMKDMGSFGFKDEIIKNDSQ